MESWGFNKDKYYEKYPSLLNVPDPADLEESMLTVFDNNVVERNIFYYPSFPTNNLYDVRHFIGTPNGKFTNNIIWNGLLGENGLPREDSIKIRDSSFWYGTPTTLTWQEWNNLSYDIDSIIADPGFVDPENDNYALKEGTIALERGHHTILVPS